MVSIVHYGGYGVGEMSWNNVTFLGGVKLTIEFLYNQEEGV